MKEGAMMKEKLSGIDLTNPSVPYSHHMQHNYHKGQNHNCNRHSQCQSKKHHSQGDPGKKETISTSKNAFGLDKGDDATTNWRNLTAFWILGLCNNYGYVVMLTAAHDILNPQIAEGLTCSAPIEGNRTCNTVSTGAIALANILPSVFIKLIAPFLPFVINLRIGTCIVLSASGFLCVAYSAGSWWAYLGVILTSTSSGLGEVTMLSYSHRYTKTVISTWASGTGGAGIIGSLSYAGLLTFLKPNETMLMMLIVPVVQAVTFWLLLTHPTPTLVMITVHGVGSQEQMIEAPKMTFGRKIGLLPKLLKYMIPLALVYFFEYFINQGLYELIEYKNFWLNHCDQYRWLQVDYQIGVFLSRSSVSFMTFNNLWLMSVLQFANVFLMLFESIFYYIPSMYIIFALVFWEGLLGGAAYVNTFYKMSKEIPWEEREAALGIASMSDSFGIALAGWASMPVHKVICGMPQPDRLNWIYYSNKFLSLFGR